MVSSKGYVRRDISFPVSAGDKLLNPQNNVFQQYPLARQSTFVSRDPLSPKSPARVVAPARPGAGGFVGLRSRFT